MIDKIISGLRGHQFCSMDSARTVTLDERESIISKIRELGPWFHNCQVAADIWTNPDGQGPSPGYPDSRWPSGFALEQSAFSNEPGILVRCGVGS